MRQWGKFIAANRANNLTIWRFPEHWAMLRHNLGLDYFDRIKGERWENLQKSIGCYSNSLKVFTQDKFPEKWQINQEDLSQSLEALETKKPNLVKDIFDRSMAIRDLKGVNKRVSLRGCLKSIN